MKIINSLIRFFGGITFAILLIATTALFVITGTLLESITDSHRYASLFTYDSKIFSWLLWGFFINILISALRRWPFKKKHIPFLITHWGLLMILGGLLIKSAYGTQGSMSLIEGSGSNEIFIADSHALYIEEPFGNKNERVSHFRQFKKGFPSYSEIRNAEAPSDTLNITLLNHSPHCIEKLNTWIKGDKAVLSGSPPFPVHSVGSARDPLPETTKILLPQGPNRKQSWNALAINCSDIRKTAEKAYIDNMQISIGDRLKDQTIATIPLQTFLDEVVSTPYGNAKGTLDFNWSPISGFLNPCLNIELQRGAGTEVTSIALSGSEALLNQSDRRLVGKSPLSIDLKGPPLLLFLQEARGDLYLFQYSGYGELFVEPFRQDNLKSLIVYNEGFGGYAVQTELPGLNLNRGEKEEVRKNLLVAELRELAANPESLPFPLAMLFQSCKDCKIDFASATLEYLSAWDHCRSWLFDDLSAGLSSETKEVIANINWQYIPSDTYRGCLWCAYLFDKLDPQLKRGKDPEVAIKELNWPPQLSQSTDPSLSLLDSITLQIFAASRELPDPPTIPLLHPSPSKLLSALFRAYGIHPDKLLEFNPQVTNDLEKPSIHLECPLTASQHPIPPLKKLENNTPCILLRVQSADREEIVSLGYDRFATRIKWPILGGRYLVRFQPLCKTIPYRLRLRQARQINYAGSQQPYSYECDLLIKELDTGHEIEKTISMNEVHETWEGYRFYLASVYPPSPGEIKKVQIVVNYDPAKYLVTYPGSLILTLGIVLLFWQKKDNGRQRTKDLKDNKDLKDGKGQRT